MKKKSFIWKILVGILSLSLILIPMTSSISLAQSSTAAGSAGAAGTAGMSTAAIVGVAAAVVAAGIAIAIVANEEEAVAVHHH
jgi:hypothetical protein